MFDYHFHGAPDVPAPRGPASGLDINSGQVYYTAPDITGWIAIAPLPPIQVMNGEQRLLPRSLDQDELNGIVPLKLAQQIIPATYIANSSPIQVLENIGLLIGRRKLGTVQDVGLAVDDQSHATVRDPDTDMVLEYDSTHAYVVGDVVTHNGVDYECMVNSTGLDPEVDAGATFTDGMFQGTKWRRSFKGMAARFGGGLIYTGGAIHYNARVTNKDAVAGTDVTVNDLPVKPAGYLTILVEGVPARIPYYATAAGQPPADDPDPGLLDTFLGCCDLEECCGTLVLGQSSSAQKGNAANGFRG